ncbi:hypothetical protein E2C01_011957 [Portunus trituberculatus]|uniref:Uncharacterized protein n=1 Tax=Portunus trituberculatus TaxID=210409 RepID=A0A5B7DCF2_PORTR|nr:hypothetical protein [Portunus trituberculatus]
MKKKKEKKKEIIRSVLADVVRLLSARPLIRCLKWCQRSSQPQPTAYLRSPVSSSLLASSWLLLFLLAPLNFPATYLSHVALSERLKASRALYGCQNIVPVSPA